jgi:hypothetical protein
VKTALACSPVKIDNGRAVFTKPTPFSDFPGEDVTLYCCNGTILLPGEE